MTGIQDLTIDGLTEAEMLKLEQEFPVWDSILDLILDLFRDDEPVQNLPVKSNDKLPVQIYAMEAPNNLTFPARHPRLYRAITSTVIGGALVAVTALAIHQYGKPARDARNVFAKAPVAVTTYASQADFQEFFPADVYAEIDNAVRKRVPEGLTTGAMATRERVFIDEFVTTQKLSDGRVRVGHPELDGNAGLGYANAKRP